MERVEIGSAVLYRGDCLEVMEGLGKSAVDSLITDPPYGKKYARGKNGLGSGSKLDRNDVAWDVKPDKTFFERAFFISKEQCFWGGNYFLGHLPPTNCMLVWDKKTGNNVFADCELAWTSLNGVVKKFELQWLGAHIHRIETIYHPTQKPLALMEWCVAMFDGLVFDPFMGSGTTGVACQNLVRQFIGVEQDTKYFDIACKRIDEAKGLFGEGDAES